MRYFLSVSMGETYETQFHYSLATQQYTASNYAVWDLALSSEGKPYIRINGGKEALVYNTGSKNFYQTYAVNGSQDWRWDNPNGHPDSTAFGDINDLQQVYLVDLGPTVPNNRYRKLQISSITDDAYGLKYANLDGSDSVIIDINRDTTRNFVYLGLTDGGKIVTPEPDKKHLGYTVYQVPPCVL